MAGAARDGFMATVGHLLNQHASEKVGGGDPAAAGISAAPSVMDGPAADGDLGPITSLGSVDLGAILRTYAQPLSPETLAYLRASGPPRSLLHDDDDPESTAPSSPAHSPSHGIGAAAALCEDLSPASGADITELPSPVQLQLSAASPSEVGDGRQQQSSLREDGGAPSADPSWDGAGLHPLDSDDVSPFDMLLSAPEEIAGMTFPYSMFCLGLHSGGGQHCLC